MRVWSIVSQKGGSGKTTLALHLAIAAMSKGIAVSVFDLDPQRSAEQWSELRERAHATEEPAVVHGTATGLDGMLQAAREHETGLVIIDTPPAVDKSMIYAAAAGHVVIVPTRSSVLDQFALRETLDYLKRIGSLPKAIVVLNAPGSDKKAKADTEAIVRREFNVALLDVALEDHADLATSLRTGRGVTESAPNRKAGKLMLEIYQQITQFERKLAKSKGRVTA